MIAGIPGTGVGGFFYLVLAFWMPILELYRMARGKGRVTSGAMVVRQFSIGLGLIFGMGVSGLLVKLIFQASRQASGQPTTAVEQTSPLLISLGILLGIQLSLAILKIVYVKKPLKGFDKLPPLAFSKRTLAQ